MSTRKKCHQKIIRDKKQEEEYLTKGEWWESIDTSPSNARVEIISYKEAKEVIIEYEWLGTMPAGAFLCVGLFFDNYLAGVEVFTIAKAGGLYTLWNEKAICLARGCCVHWCPKWGSSFLISRALKIMQEYYEGEPRYVLAYSDWEAGEIGTVYQATNWIYLGAHNKPEWRDPNGKRYDENHHRDKARTIDKDFKLKRKLNPEIVQKIKQEMIDEGWTKNKTKRGRYATVIGYNGKKKKEMLKKLKDNAKPYPKTHA